MSGNRGRLVLVLGPMYAGKTTELLGRLRGERRARACEAVKPAFDVRYGADRIASHDGDAEAARPIRRWGDVDPAARAVFIDEVQFLEPPHFDGDAAAGVGSLLSRGVDVTACGLDTDWRRVPFRVAAALEAMADSVVRRTARCAVCGGAAAWTFKKSGAGPSVELGAGETYEARCGRCWPSAPA